MANPSYIRQLKLLLIRVDGDKSIEDVCRIAKAEGEKLGMGDRKLLQVMEVMYMPRVGGFAVAVESLW